MYSRELRKLYVTSCLSVGQHLEKSSTFFSYSLPNHWLHNPQNDLYFNQPLPRLQKPMLRGLHKLLSSENASLASMLIH